MTVVDVKKMRLLPIVMAALLSGCSAGTLFTQPAETAPAKVASAPPPKEEVKEEVCPNCLVEPRIPRTDCAKGVAVVNYADRCQLCGRFPVTVRAYGQEDTCM